MRPDSCQDFTVWIPRCRGIKMFPVHAYLPIAVRLQSFVPAHIKALWRQYQQGFHVLLKQFTAFCGGVPPPSYRVAEGVSDCIFLSV